MSREGMRIPMLDLRRQYASLREEILEATDRVLASGRWILGPEVKALEEELAPMCGGAQAIGCASGTDALYLCLKALEIGPGDDVVIPTFTFFATAGAVVRSGARPVFADVSDETFNLTPATVEAALTPRTRAVIAVHLFGQCADMSAIGELAGRSGIHLIEDAAQSLGARWDDVPAGALGRLAAFSFYPTKNLGACGDGGLVTTLDPELAEVVRQLRVHGAHPKYIHRRIGTNSRLDALQAAILRIKLRRLPQWEELRREHALRYGEALNDLAWLRLPTVDRRARMVWNQYTLRVVGGSRDRLREHLDVCGVGTEIYYPLPLHLQSCFADLGGREGDRPQAERLSREVLSIPIDPEMSQEGRERVIQAIREWAPD